MNNLVQNILIIGAVVTGGYLIFMIEYQPDSELGLYTIELPINDEVDFYNVAEPSQTLFDMTRSNQETKEIITIQNANSDEELKIWISPVKGDQITPTPYSFPSKSDERNMMFLDLIMKELVLTGIAALGLFLLNRPEKEIDIVE